MSQLMMSMCASFKTVSNALCNVWRDVARQIAGNISESERVCGDKMMDRPTMYTRMT